MLSALCRVTRMRTGPLCPYDQILFYTCFIAFFLSHATVFSYCHCIQGQGQNNRFLQKYLCLGQVLLVGIENQCVCWQTNKGRDLFLKRLTKERQQKGE